MYLLDAQTLVPALTEAHQVSVEPLCIRLEPALWFERKRVWKDGLVLVSVFRAHAYHGLFQLATVSLDLGKLGAYAGGDGVILVLNVTSACSCKPIEVASFGAEPLFDDSRLINVSYILRD